MSEPYSYRLPKGFHDRTGSALEVENFIRAAVIKRGLEIGCAPIRTSPVGFADHFRKAASTTGDKTYLFEDRKGRELILVPDSTPAIMRHYLDNRNVGPARYVFDAQIFRYRRFKYRNFHQLGFAFVNELPLSDDDINLHALTLLKAGLRLLNTDMRVDMHVEFQNYAIWLCLFRRAGFTEEEGRAIMHHMRPLSTEQQLALIASRIDCPTTVGLAEFLLYQRDCSDLLKIPDKEICHLIKSTMLFAENAVSETGISYKIATDSFHASELQSGIAFEIKDIKNRTFSDGGCYTAYAHRYNASILSLQSFAIGIEYFIESGYNFSNSKRVRSVIILEMGDNSFDMDHVERNFMQAGFSVVRRKYQIHKRSQDIDRYRTHFDWIVLPGKADGTWHIIPSGGGRDIVTTLPLFLSDFEGHLST